ncbi:lactate utilization protein [Porcipelethomonas sp.]|uniref:lactate utilization protein n=1 Tax=Porcipelethomonas sp. TaxID=2981675 RepID=UPI003EF20867
MDKNTEKIIALRLERTKAALEKNNMKVFIAKTKEEAAEIAKGLINKGDVIGSGGSMSLEQAGIMEFLRCGDYKLLDRKNFTPETLRDFFIGCFNADAYFTSANAITENGELYNVDGNSNRIAAIAYGPKSVIVIAGYNKIVKNLEDAAKRVKEIAAPANAVRLDCNTYCAKNGECAALAKESCPEMTAGCGSDDRICCNYLISAKQRHKDRIKVILVAESLGY